MALIFGNVPSTPAIGPSGGGETVTGWAASFSPMPDILSSALTAFRRWQIVTAWIVASPSACVNSHAHSHYTSITLFTTLTF